jgi:hypothetical protein
MDLPIRTAVNLRFSSHWAEKAVLEETGRVEE